MLRVLAVILALCAPAVAAPALVCAQGVPALDPADETLIVEPGVVPGAALTYGEFVADEKGIALAADGDAPRDQNFWLPEHPAATFADGFVRFRFTVGKRLDSTILFRLTANGDDLNAMSGYGLSIERDTVYLYRWDDGVPLPLGEKQTVKALKGKASSVEGAIWMIGPHITVQLYDGKTLSPIASLVVTDHQYVRGRVALRSYGKQDAASRLTLLAVRAANTASRQLDSPIGNARFAELATEDLSELPDDAHARILERDLGNGQALVELSPRGLEVARRAGVRFARLHTMPVYSFLDADLREARRLGLEKTSRGFRIDRAYKDPATVEALLRGYHERYPELTRLVEIGRSHDDQPIWALKISDNAAQDEDEPAVLLNGAHHGVELLSTEFVIDAIAVLLEDYRDDSAVRRLVDGLEIWCVPLVNPDGNLRHLDHVLYSGRKNGRDTNRNGRIDPGDGVDLNRNYPFKWHALGEKGSSSQPRHNWYRGPLPGSEPETQAMMRLADSEHFTAAVSYHTWGTVILSPYTIDNLKNPKPDEAWAIAEAMSARAGEQPNGRPYAVKKQIYSVDGVDQDWFRFAHGTVAMLVEGAYHNPGASQRVAAVEANRGTWLALLERVLDGPGIYGQVTDAQGNPVVATVRIAEVSHREGERWTTRCRDGRYDRQLPGPGTYTLVVELPGLEPVEKRVTVGERQRKRLDIALPLDGVSPASLVELVCPDPVMCAVETHRLASLGECVRPESRPSVCAIDGAQLEAGTLSPNGCSTCRPQSLAREWSPLPAGTACAPAACTGGELRQASTCDADGACTEGTTVSCAPYVGCSADGAACATHCEADTDCTAGFACSDARCVPATAASDRDDRVGAGQGAPPAAASEKPEASAEEGGGCSISGAHGGERRGAAAGALALGVLLLLSARQERAKGGRRG